MPKVAITPSAEAGGVGQRQVTLKNTFLNFRDSVGEGNEEFRRSSDNPTVGCSSHAIEGLDLATSPKKCYKSDSCPQLEFYNALWGARHAQPPAVIPSNGHSHPGSQHSDATDEDDSVAGAGDHVIDFWELERQLCKRMDGSPGIESDTFQPSPGCALTFGSLASSDAASHDTPSNTGTESPCGASLVHVWSVPVATTSAARETATAEATHQRLPTCGFTSAPAGWPSRGCPQQSGRATGNRQLGRGMRQSQEPSHFHVPRRTDLAKEYGTSKEHGQPITTMMLRNIPNRYTQVDLIEEVDHLGFSGSYDFFYLPIDKATGHNVGYAFLNFANERDADRFSSVLHDYRFMRHQQRPCRVAAVSVAHIQGLENNLRHYARTAVTDSKCKQRRPLALKGLDSVGAGANSRKNTW